MRGEEGSHDEARCVRTHSIVQSISPMRTIAGRPRCTPPTAPDDSDDDSTSRNANGRGLATPRTKMNSPMQMHDRCNHYVFVYLILYTFFTALHLVVLWQRTCMGLSFPPNALFAIVVVIVCGFV